MSNNADEYQIEAQRALAHLKEVANHIRVPLTDSSVEAYVNVVTMWATLSLMARAAEKEETWIPET